MVLVIVGQGLVQSAQLRQPAAVQSSGSTAGLPDQDSFGFREFILRAGNGRIVDFQNGGPEATIAQIIPASEYIGKIQSKRAEIRHRDK